MLLHCKTLRKTKNLPFPSSPCYGPASSLPHLRSLLPKPKHSHLASCIQRRTREASSFLLFFFFLKSPLHPPKYPRNLTTQSSTKSKQSRHNRSFYPTPRWFEREIDRQTKEKKYGYDVKLSSFLFSSIRWNGGLLPAPGFCKLVYRDYLRPGSDAFWKRGGKIHKHMVSCFIWSRVG